MPDENKYQLFVDPAQKQKKPIEWKKVLPLSIAGMLEAINFGNLTGIGNATIRVFTENCELPILSVFSPGYMCQSCI